MKKKKILALFLMLAMLCSLAACGTSGADAGGTGQETAAEGSYSAQDAEKTGMGKADKEVTSENPGNEFSGKPTEDRSGAPIAIPEQVESVVVLAPSITETLLDLGCADKIIAVDTQTSGFAYEKLPANLTAFDMMMPDTEQLAALQPDIIFISGMTDINSKDPYADLKKLGFCVVSIPSPDSIQGVKEDIAFIAACMGKPEEGKQIIDEMTREIDRIAEIGKTITEKKTVYFEIAAAPYAYSFGRGVFLNEMIELVGAENLLSDQEGWLPVEVESIVAANPDVILTNVNYMEDPVGEILSREGWGGVNAVKNKEVYYIDSRAASLPDENIVKALKEMAEAIYPEDYEE